MFPNIYGQGALFGFSGLEGENKRTVNFCGCLCGEQLGVEFLQYPAAPTLSYVLSNIRGFDFHVVSSDWIDFSVKDLWMNRYHGGELFFVAEGVMIGYGEKGCVPSFSCQEPSYLTCDGNMTCYAADGIYIAFVREQKEDTTYFALARGETMEEAKQKANDNLCFDFKDVHAKKEAVFKNLPEIDAPESVQKLFAKCVSVMKSQIYSPEGRFSVRYCTPDRYPHKQTWFWDSVFHSFSYDLLDETLPADILRSVKQMQTEEGRIPSMTFHDKQSRLTQPPIFAYGLQKYYDRCGDALLVAELYDSIKKNLLWYDENRDVNKNGLYEWYVDESDPHCRCGESGMDNSVRFDNVTYMDCIDLSCYMAKEFSCMKRLSEVLNNGEATYWQNRYETLKKAINETLWDEETGLYYDRKHKTGKLHRVRTISCFLPLFAGICDEKQAESLVSYLTDEKEFKTPFPIPSISISDPVFGVDMWNGPVWINLNYMISEGLAEYGYKALAKEIIEKTVAELARWYMQDGVLYEFYDSFTKTPPKNLERKGKMNGIYNFIVQVQPIRDYGWSCNLTADMIRHLYKK